MFLPSHRDSLLYTQFKNDNFSSMGDFLGISHETSDQNAGASPARRKRDLEDILKMVEFLAPLEPFSSTASNLRNIITGVSFLLQ